jgi:hypothetical protein
MPLSRINSASIANSAISAADIADGTITAAKIISVANTQITGNITAAQITSVANTQLTGTITGSQISSNTLSNTVFQTGSVENYMRAAELGFGMRNRIINGDMRIDQRNGGSAVTVNTVGIFSVDRWANIARATGGGVYSAQQVSDAPTGYSNSLKLTVTTVDTSLGTNDYYFSWQKIEGFNTADLLFGTASAKTVTLSFWVKSNITGQFSAFLTNSAESYSQPFAYTINAANTWERKTLTFTGATAGTWVGATNGVGLIVGFGLANGTSLQGTSGAWAAASYYGSTGDVNWMATLSNTFQYTGVQLEVGSQATSFDFRSIGTELALCQRYFYQMAKGTNIPLGISACTGTTDLRGCLWFPVYMRTSPSMTSVSGTGYYRIYTGAANQQFTNIGSDLPGPQSWAFGSVTGLSGVTTGHAGIVLTDNANSNLSFSAEL